MAASAHPMQARRRLRWWLVLQSSLALGGLAHLLRYRVHDRHHTTLSSGGQLWAVLGLAPHAGHAWHCAESAPVLGYVAQHSCLSLRACQEPGVIVLCCRTK
jgi:hypothetical protein